MTAIIIGGTNNEVIARTRREGTGFWLYLFFEAQAKRHARIWVRANFLVVIYW